MERSDRHLCHNCHLDHLDLPDPVVAQAGVVFKVELLQSGDDGNEQFGAPERHSERHHNLHCQVRH